MFRPESMDFYNWAEVGSYRDDDAQAKHQSQFSYISHYRNNGLMMSIIAATTVE